VSVAVGIDVAEEGKGLDLVGLNVNRKIVASYSRLTVREAGTLILSEIRPDIVCIDSPSGWAQSGKSRQSERALAAMGISSFATGPDPGDHGFYQWMRVGFSVYQALEGRYPLFRGEQPQGTAAETFPYATAVLLAGRKPVPGEVKNAFRRGVLQQHAVDDTGLRTIDQVDAALCALTGIIALEGRWRALGAATEGMILIPDTEPAASAGQPKRRSSRPAKSPVARQSASKRKNASGPKP
jgi:predicted nuclease with RNAse H fold